MPRLALLTVGALLAAACSATPPALAPDPSVAGDPAAAAVTAPLPATEPVEETTSAPEIQATELLPDEAATPSGAIRDAGVPFEQQGVRLSYHPSLATGVSATRVPALPASYLPPEAIAPEHRQLTLEGYAARGSMLTPTITVFPVQDYAAVNPAAHEALTELQSLLTSQTWLPGRITAPNMSGVTPMTHAQVRYVPFQRGTGVRFITQYTQGVSPLSNEGLVYVFLGLTSDGRFYVSAVLPVAATVLDPASPDAVPYPTPDPSDAGRAAYRRYIAAVTAQLEALPSSAFTPDLALLDALVQSIAVEERGAGGAVVK